MAEVNTIDPAIYARMAEMWNMISGMGTLGSAVPLASASAGAPGASGNSSREDHVHPLPALTVSTPSRALGTAFTPDAAKWVWCSYSVNLSVTNPLLAGSSSASIRLLSDTSATPTTERARVTNSSSVSLTVSVQITQPQVMQISYLCPPGHKVLLTLVTSGTASGSIATQTEIAVG